MAHKRTDQERHFFHTEKIWAEEGKCSETRMRRRMWVIGQLHRRLREASGW